VFSVISIITKQLLDLVPQLEGEAPTLLPATMRLCSSDPVLSEKLPHRSRRHAYDFCHLLDESLLSLVVEGLDRPEGK